LNLSLKAEYTQTLLCNRVIKILLEGLVLTLNLHFYYSTFIFHNGEYLYYIMRQIYFEGDIFILKGDIFISEGDKNVSTVVAHLCRRILSHR
jgi:hypothetical protein